MTLNAFAYALDVLQVLCFLIVCVLLKLGWLLFTCIIWDFELFLSDVFYAGRCSFVLDLVLGGYCIGFGKDLFDWIAWGAQNKSLKPL